MRDEILLGRTPPGTQLPSTGELATVWNSSSSTIHNALVTLVKEGWIQRLNGAGTFVADPGNRFVCAGIYYPFDIFADESPFGRTWNASLIEHFRQIGKTTQVFIDTRPPSEQKEVLPAMAKAVAERRIQCVVAGSVSELGWPAFSRLKVPMAFIDNPGNVNRVNFDFDDLIREAVARVRAAGCRSIGVISSVNPKSPLVEKMRFYENFQSIARQGGLETRPEWLLSPNGYVADAELYGYEQFMRLWAMKDRPDSLLATPDWVVRGVITAILELGITEVPPQMKFVFHRNAKTRFLCPFPAAWGISDENTWAESIVGMIQKQFNGEPISSVLLPFAFEDRLRIP